MGKQKTAKFEGKTVSVPVRTLVQFLYACGGLTRTSFMVRRALEGARAHRKLQGSRGPGYQPEVALKESFVYCGLRFILSGRADGVVDHPGKSPLIEEIKTHWGRKPHEPGFLDLAQARIYAAMYLNRRRKNEAEGKGTVSAESAGQESSSCAIRMTYYDLVDEQETCFDSLHSYQELSFFLKDSLEKYAAWIQKHMSRLSIRNRSLLDYPFPFSFRTGQREMAAQAYLASKTETGSSFLMAPTGMGKTLGMLFSALKILGEERGDRIFYVTAKTTGKAGVACGADILQRSGAHFTWLVLTAKERICLQPDLFCHFDACPYALHFYDHLGSCMQECLSGNALDRANLEELARKHQVCPYYLSRELIPWVDLVIGDFNHAFDPGSRLSRLMEEEMKTVLLVDEAHNLPARARAMFSCTCGKKEFLALRRKVIARGEGEETRPALRAVGKALWRLNQVFLQQWREMEDSGLSMKRELALPKELDRALQKCFVEVERSLSLAARRGGGSDREDDMSALYFLLWEIRRCFEAIDDSYRIIWERIGTDVKLHVLCVHPGRNLTEVTQKTVAKSFFSATMHPIDFYRRELGGLKNEVALSFPSPFPREHLLLIVAPFINTRHRFRNQSLPDLNEVITQAIAGKTGNYLVFFPSFEYLKQSWTAIEGKDEFWFQQERNWNEKERAEFLEHFQERPERTHVGFCVLGGIFSEGIDLQGGRLDGAIIVGVGWPPRSIMADLIQEYYESQPDHSSFEALNFAYLYPGWGRVLQAAGRVIRSVEDRGFVVLAGDRFASSEHRPLFPSHWTPPEVASSPREIKELISDFWS